MRRCCALRRAAGSTRFIDTFVDRAPRPAGRARCRPWLCGPASSGRWPACRFLLKDLSASLAGAPERMGSRALCAVTWPRRAPGSSSSGSRPGSCHSARRTRRSGATTAPRSRRCSARRRIRGALRSHRASRAADYGGGGGGRHRPIASVVMAPLDPLGRRRVCGLVGLKPRRGRSSFAPAPAMCSSGSFNEHVLSPHRARHLAPGFSTPHWL